MQDMQVPFLSWEDALEMAAHFSFLLLWEIPKGQSLLGYSPWGLKRMRQQQLTNNNNNISMKRNKPQSFLIYEDIEDALSPEVNWLTS